MSDKEKNDDWILANLQSPDKPNRDRALREMYQRFFPSVVIFVKMNNGSKAEASDVFQDALIVFYTKVQKGELKLTSSIKAYVDAICRNLWLNVLRRKNKQTNLEEVPEMQEEDFFGSLVFTEKQQLIKQAISGLGEGCQKILAYYYYDRLRMKKIAEMMGLANDQVAKNKKADCLKRLRKIINDSPSLKNNLQ